MHDAVCNTISTSAVKCLLAGLEVPAVLRGLQLALQGRHPLPVSYACNRGPWAILVLQTCKCGL